MSDVCMSHASNVFVKILSNYLCMLDVYMSLTSYVFVNRMSLSVYVGYVYIRCVYE